MKKLSFCLAMAVVCGLTNAATAEPPSATGEGPGAAASPPPRCSTGERGALTELGCEMSRALGPLPAGALVVASPLVTKEKVPHPGRLTARTAKVIAGALGRGAHSVDEPGKLEHGRTLASEAGTLVHLEVELTLGEIRVTADVYPVPRSFWDRVRDPKPSPVKHAFASRRIDAEIQSFLPAIPLVASRVDKASSPERSTVALACNDVDSDGSLELVVVARRRIHLGRIRRGKLVAHATAAWKDLSAISPRPLREPIGSVVVNAGRHIDIGLTDREKGVRLGPTLASDGVLSSKMPWPSGGCSNVYAQAVDPRIERCRPTDAAPAVLRFKSPVDAVAGARILDANGAARLVAAGRIKDRDVALLEDDSRRRARVTAVGAQLAVGDLDRNGDPEVLAGANTLDRKADALIVHTWKSDGTVVERFRLAVPSGVQALAVCPPDGPGLSPIAMATGDGIWIVR